ncbi:hypothetical protein [Microbacterium sp. P04]|uniref:hypothetical protein n=1 Tax=Microbacterium sp. P04 TaxID=3366947 RepID=UPI0037460BAF
MQAIADRILPERWAGIDIGRGWWPLLVRLDERLARDDPGYRLLEVTNKLGRVSVRMAHESGTPYSPGVRAALRAAKETSSRTCEQCGQRGQICRLRRGFITVLCEDHVRAENATPLNKPTAHNPWTEIVGPCFTRSALERELSVDSSAVTAAVTELRALELNTSDGVKLYPVWQVVDGTLVGGLQPVLNALRSGFDESWTWANWLAATPPGGMHSHLEELLAGDLNSVVVQAQHAAAAWRRR